MVKTNKARHGKDFYIRIGRLGGLSHGGTGGFGSLLVGSDGLTGPERAKRFANTKRGNARAAIGWEVDLSGVDLPVSAIIWYQAP